VALADDLAADAEAETLAGFERRLADLRRDRDSARVALRAAQAETSELRHHLGLIDRVNSQTPAPPKWQTPKRPKAGNRAIVTTILSDMHFDEVVDPAEMGGRNAYDRLIATKRLRRYFEKVVSLARDYTTGVTIEGCVLMLGGDSITGEIHDEYARTNADSIPGTLLYWSEQIAAGIDMLADEFGRVSVYECPGNHGRMSRKVEPKQMARRSFDWLLANMVGREFKRDERVTFTITDAFDARFDVYDTTYLLHHGMVGGSSAGSGIGGIWPTIMRDDAKRRNMQQAVGAPYDIACMGHWHQYTWGPGRQFVINGSLKGYDEFARFKGFGFEPPQQSWWLTTPEHGVSFAAPVLVQDRAREKW
jgi:hypothetical protein